MNSDRFFIVLGVAILLTLEILIGIEGHEVRGREFLGSLPTVMLLTVLGPVGYAISSITFTKLYQAAVVQPQDTLINGANAVILPLLSLHVLWLVFVCLASGIGSTYEFFFNNLMNALCIGTLYALTLVKGLSKHVQAFLFAMIYTIWLESYLFPRLFF